jgi:hypothetical protein
VVQLLLMCVRMVPEQNEQMARVLIRNGSDRMARMTLRPLGSIYEMAPGAQYEVRARGPVGDPPCVEYVEEGVIVMGWPGCVLTVHLVDPFGVPRLTDMVRVVRAPPALELRLRPPERDYSGDDD